MSTVSCNALSKQARASKRAQEAPSIRARPSPQMGDAEAAEAPAAAPAEAPPAVEFVPPSLEIAKAEGARSAGTFQCAAADSRAARRQRSSCAPCAPRRTAPWRSCRWTPRWMRRVPRPPACKLRNACVQVGCSAPPASARPARARAIAVPARPERPAGNSLRRPWRRVGPRRALPGAFRSRDVDI